MTAERAVRYRKVTRNGERREKIAVLSPISPLEARPSQIFTHQPMPSHPFNMADVDSLLLSLIEKEIPEGRQALRDGHENLAKVAAYCEQKYVETNNRYKSGSDRGQALKETRAVLDETKQFATQSLASVAYQINTLALNMLSLLDQQVLKMQDMESRINHIAEVRLPR